MQKKVKVLLVSGVILWLAGAASLFWTFEYNEKQQQQLSQQNELYDTKLAQINELANKQGEVQPYKEIINEALSTQKTEDISKNYNAEMLSYFSMSCISLGTVIFLSLASLWLVHFIAGKNSNPQKGPVKLQKSPKISADIPIKSSSQDEEKKVAVLTQTLYEPAKFDASTFGTDQRKFHPSRAASEKDVDSMLRPDMQDKFFIDKSESGLKPINHQENTIHGDILSSYNENAMKLQDSIKQQAEKLEQQVAEIKNLTQSVVNASTGNNKPLDNNLTELTEQIAAIRDYASTQQERVTKLQEGYDWNIIRTFCLRIIRCIDNVDSRIEDISRQGGDTSDLEDIKDDLVFALESSGVEQFTPQVNIDYASVQKVAEAVKERKSCDDPAMKGNIAEIIKPGYRYVIGEDSTKVVRVAQVKLFG
ncbi:MAG TPA: hypothetical protein PLP05_01585 [Sedimentisphaerales bacterium]|nr:hypothetical protein [Sedimentisphaerales bacterium]